MDISSTACTCSQLHDPISYQESTPLLSQAPCEQHCLQTLRTKVSYLNFIPRQLCLPSKAAVLILFWTAAVGAITKATENAALHILDVKYLNKWTNDNFGILIIYLVFVLVYFLYPFAGFLADVYYSRYKIVTISLCLLLFGNGCLCVTSILIFTRVVTEPYYTLKNIPYYVFTVGPGLLFFVAGFSGYQANVNQLGLDQLLDAPSEYLGLCVHWLLVFTHIGFFVSRPIFALFDACNRSNSTFHVLLTLPFLFFLFLLLLILLGCWKRHWFYSEPGQSNPYKVVLKVLSFIWKHKYPLRRSAFTYCGDEDPSRIDFAKEKYGGPFTTEQVEDVKTLFKIMAILLVIGPIFFLEIPLGLLFSSFSEHISSKMSQTLECSSSSLFQHMTVLRSLSAITAFPIYIWLIYCVLRRCIPRTLVRIWIGEVLYFLGIITLFIIDLSGHAMFYASNHQAAACIFIRNDTIHTFFLDLPWAVNILPAFLMEVALGLIITTTFEFISAQSPHFMKGLLIGVFFAIRGTFKLLGAMSTIPFSLHVVWASNYMKTNMPPITNCGFGYLLLNTIVGLISVLMLTVAAKWYRYRERNDPPYNQEIVERVWADGLQSKVQY